jgi:glycine/D-amino acid oxidase-like deaminating enzyme/nitrite reductase/ring-hydroxylating ferredoxin subunit
MVDSATGASVPFWQTFADIPPLPSLQADAHCDICVVGAGIAGLTTAYLLARAGKRVVVLESRNLGDGETGHTSAHLANALDDRFANLERLFGTEGARLAAESHGAAIDRIEGIAREEGIACDFERLDGYLFAAPGQSIDLLDQELAAAHRAGLTGVERLARAPLGAYDTGPCLRFPRQGQFHPMKYLAGLVRATQLLGGRVFGHSHAKDIAGGPDAHVNTADGHTVRAAAVVVATNTPVNDRFTMHTKQYAYRTYAVAAPLPAGTVTRALYWDTADPYHYVRLQRVDSGEDLLIVGGEDHKTGQSADPEVAFRRLEAWTRERFPAARTLAYHWSGQVLEPMDALAYIGRNPGDAENVFIVTGDSGHGLTHGTIAGMLLTDLIFGRENPWGRLYDPARKTHRAAGEFVKENVNVAVQYADWLTPGEAATPADVRPRQGAVVRSGLKKLAVSRDEFGQLHVLSAVCPHLGCIVHWNDAEKTWDCPCHGSRFDTEGRVLNGPALGGLAEVRKAEKVP